MNVKISFPDGNTREFPKGVTGAEIARSISEGLARNALAIELNAEVIELSRPINSDGAIKILTWTDAKGKNTFWHSSAHLLAEALEALYRACGDRASSPPPAHADTLRALFVSEK